MNLEVGMYLRYEGLYDDCPIIQKITKLETPGRCGGKYKVFTDETNDWFIDSDYLEMAVKNGEVPMPSFNIVDLIEEGDYVNGRKVYQVGYNFQDDFVLKMSKSNYDDFIYSNEIETIVTKEQMKQIEYKIN